MRPIKLMMQAFGPYAGTQELNMDELGETGIYAITGETGAGKTTIFDAIVYALYGSGSGEDRADGKSLRAVGASPDVETKVALDFVSNGKMYHIERRPEQYLTGKRKGEPVKKVAAQVLTMPDETRYTRDRDITEKIEKDILGVTKDQFCQIVMIAQGEFRKLLRADTKERTKILRKIFKTERFDSLAQQFKQLCSKKYADYCRSREQVSFALNAMQAEPDSPLFGEWSRLKQTKANALNIDDALALVERLVAQDEAEYKDAAEALTLKKEALEKARTAFEETNRRAKAQKDLETLRATLDSQQKQLTDAEAARVNAEAQKPEIERLGTEITTENNWLPKYAELDDKATTQERLKKDLETAEAARDKARQESERLQVKQTALTEEAEGLKDAHDRRQSFSEKLNEAKATGDKLRALNDRVEARDKAVTALKNAKAAEERAAKDEQAAAGALAKCQAELDALGNTELTVSTLEGVEKSLTDRAKALEEERALYDRFVEAGKSYADAQSILEQKKKLAQKKAYTASWLNQHYNDNIAGILAKDLLEGMPCPVCGSVHHPDPRVLSTDAVIDKAVVDAAEAAAKEAEDEANEKAKVCERKNAECDSLKTQLVERMPDVLEADWPSEIQRRQSENAAAQRENAGKLKLAKDADARKQRLQKTELPKAQKDVDNATERLKKASEARTKAETDHKNAEAEVTNAAAIMPAGWTPLDLSDALSENGRQQAAMKQGREAAERDIRRLDEIGKQREQNRQSIDAQSKIAQNQEVKIAELETSIKNGQQALDDLKAELPYPAKADCERAICEKSKQKKALEDAIKAAQNEENRLNQAIANTEGQIKPLEDALKDAPPADTAAEAIYKEAQAAHEQAAKLEKAVDKRRDNNRRQQEKLSKESEAARKQEAEYRMMKDVSDTANGDVTGKAKVTLETYAQAAYFDRIIAYANARLFHMSRHQFDLVRRDTEDAEKRSQTGLDLDIKDYANGQTRAVGTLSGGEGFLAALSLALGMSDAIQASKASAVQLDAMFVDEGFGSLSESFLELVMDELNDTAAVGHRLIGVISHVDEVKDGIERRIEVEKSALGVSTAKIR